MARTFTITCAAGTIRLAGQARGECTFTITNTSAAVVRAHPTVIALDARAQNWFGVVGEPVRELAPGQTVQITVTILPAGAPPGRYSFRLDMLPAEGGERSAGPEACVELTSEAAPLPVGSKPFPWWLLVIAAALLVIIGVVLWLALRDSGSTGAAATKDATGVPAPSDAVTEPTKDPMAVGTAPKDPAPGRTVFSHEPADAQALAERWLASFRKQDAKQLAAITSAPAFIGDQRADDATAILKLYTALLKQRSAAKPALGATRTSAKPVQARMRDVSKKIPTGARDLGLTDDDPVIGVTVPESGLNIVLLIRQGPQLRIAAVIP